MRAFKDDRGRAYNDVFPAIGVGDVNVGILYPGTIKAFHRHQRQDDHWFCAVGHLRAVLWGDGESHPQDQGLRVVYLSEGDYLHIPARVWHGVQNVGSGEGVLLYHITNKYDPTNPDEDRAEWNAFHSWEKSRK
jgi:dTDP-4-dehydrorhamnose 3,5-epimerase